MKFNTLINATKKKVLEFFPVGFKVFVTACVRLAFADWTAGMA